MAVVYLALGSNQGAREGNIRRAIDELRRNAVTVEKMAAIIETDPVGGPPQGKFLNTVIKARATISPVELLRLTQSIEEKLGRVKTSRDGPRLMDIDILLYDDMKIKTRDLVIPHPRMMERSFVLQPLREIDPALVHQLIASYREALILNVIAV